ncbi:UNVERIFIED_ASMBLY: hypothetical protein SD1_70 [Shigella phage 2019SD1]|uniref:Uncharacterized protein n=1 Tax=Shigella phage 2019SD1 TaxID=2848074 RepID=A0A6M5CDT7_9CAUD|nr:hypothetical protein H1N84_gp69 [Shigella phage 2019SD1]
MITINLSEEQAKKLLHAVGSRALCGSTDEMIIDHEVARELLLSLIKNSHHVRLTRQKLQNGLLRMDTRL